MSALTEARTQKAVDDAITEYGMVLTAVEFRKLAKVGSTTIQRWRAENVGPQPFRIGRNWRYSTEAVVRWLSGEES